MAPRRTHSLRALALSFGSKRRSSPEPPSPTFSDVTHASAMNFGPNGPEKIITRANLKASVNAYDNLMNVSAEYRAALLNMAKVTAVFADALQSCSSLKGPSYDAGTRLQAASGLHHLIGNHWHVLAEAIDKQFEKPLRQHLETYRTIVKDRSASYENALREKSQIIRDTETRSLNRRERNLQSFRDALNILQRQVDELDDLKASHYREIVDHEEKVWEVVQAKACIVVRSTMDVFDRVTAKASDPVIEVMLQSAPDPFDSYGPPPGDDQIFSILAPLSIMSTQLPSPGLPSSHLEYEAGEPSASEKITSWLPGTNNGITSPESTEWASVGASISPVITPPRSVSPPITLRKQSSPPSRKSESRLRNVLTVIDETVAPPEAEDSDTPTRRTSPIPNGQATQPDTGQEQQLPWSMPHYGHSPYEESPPQNSILFPQSPDVLRDSPAKSQELPLPLAVAS